MSLFILKNVMHFSSGDMNLYEFYQNEEDVFLRKNEIIRSFRRKAEDLLEDYNNKCIEDFFIRRGAYQFIENMEGFVLENQLIENIVCKFFCCPNIFYFQN
jgi:hypothetical protein